MRVCSEVRRRETRIEDLRPDDAAAIHEVASLLVAGFAENSPGAWSEPGDAEEEVRESFGTGRLSLVARSDAGPDGRILGWIGGIPEYDGRAWELHPLVVRGSEQGRGVGSALVRALEDRVRERGGLTVFLGTDDENDRTSLSQANLFDHLWERITSIRNLRRHPYEFYQKLGYQIVGVIPDANGLGKPDILMAKSLVR